MITLVRRLASSRPWRKFRRNRWAMVSLGIIALYVLVGLASLVGLITRQDATQRVGPDSVRGWLETPKGEERLRACEFQRRLVETALARADQAAALAEVNLAGRRVAELPVDELRARAKSLAQLQSDIADVFDEMDEIRVEVALASRASPGEEKALTAEQAKAKEARIAALRAEAEPKLRELEERTAQILPIPPGTQGTLYRLHMALGTDRQGRSIAVRALYSVRVALQVGIIVGLVAVAVGTLLGAAAAFYGGWVDHAVTWLYTTFSSTPELVLLCLLAYVLQGKQKYLPDELTPVYIALSLTFWIGPCRVIRGEVLKIRQLEYVQAATSIGFGRLYILLRHVLPNTVHLMLINFSLLFIGAIKYEVILTFLGLGVKEGASWGILIDQSRQEVMNGFFWQIGTATVLMFGLVLPFNIVSDALQDAFDPKHVD